MKLDHSLALFSHRATVLEIKIPLIGPELKHISCFTIGRATLERQSPEKLHVVLRTLLAHRK